MEKVERPNGVVFVTKAGKTAEEKKAHIERIDQLVQADFQKRRGTYIRENWLEYLGIAISAPAILLILGSLVGWVSQGFRRSG